MMATDESLKLETLARRPKRLGIRDESDEEHALEATLPVMRIVSISK